MKSLISRLHAVGVSTLLLSPLTFSTSSAFAQELEPTSLNSEIQVLPAPGAVVIDGKTDDWDLSAGVWSYNDPTIVEKTSVWTHLMWDEKGVYFLARYNDKTPMKNATRGKDFAKSWQADAYQARVIFDDGTPDEHQMHVNLFYSSTENKPYMIVYHGGFGDNDTGKPREDLLERFGPTMEKAGGQVAFSAWPDGKGYNTEAFWPWSFARLNGQPLKPGEQFTFGIEAMWGTSDGASYVTHRLADGITDNKVNRIFMFRARRGWGRAVISDKGRLDLSQQQVALQQQRLKQFVNYETFGTIPIKYSLPEDRDVTIAIDNAKGVRVRNLFGQYPRKAGENTDLWDGLDDGGNPVPPGKYTFTIVDHKPIEVKFFNSVYNAGTPPWRTDTTDNGWGANHGHPTTVATRGDCTIIGFTGTEGATGIMRINAAGIIQWRDTTETLDAALDDKFAYALSADGWTNRTVVRRFDLATGSITPFEDEKRSPDALIFPGLEASINSSIAVAGNRLLIHIPGKGLYVMEPNTGAIGAPLLPAAGAAGILAVTDRDGEAYALLSDGSVALINSEGRIGQRVLATKGLKAPTRLAVSEDKTRFAISDIETNQVHIFDRKGKRLSTLGAAYAAVNGMRPAGKFIETNFIRPLGLDFDRTGKLWVAEAERNSKRVTSWTPDNKLHHQYWGSADYGAMAAFPVTYDSTRFIAHGVEFQLDPKPNPWQRPTDERPLIFHPALSPTRGLVYRTNGHDYAANTPGYNGGENQPVTIFKRDKNGIFQPCVRFSYARGKEVGRAWIDHNDNGLEEADEITTDVKGAPHYWSNGWVRSDLTILTADSLIYPVLGFSKSGVPLYDFSKPVMPPNAVKMVNGQGSVGTMTMDNAGNISDGIYYATLDGRRGQYPNLYGRHDAPAAQRGVLIAPFRTNGVVENVPGVGSITALGSDRGHWFLMSMDGLYISSILQDAKGDVTLDESFTGQESFGGFLWRDDKGRVLAQLGGASYRLVEVVGLDTTRKNIIAFDVTSEQIEKGNTLAGLRRAVASQEPTELKIARVAALPVAPVIPNLEKGQPLIAGASDFRITESGNPSRWFRAALAHDGKNLVISYQINDPNPWKNAEGRFTHAFIGGDAIDLKLDVPGRGPIRVLAAPVGGQNTVVYWQKKAAQQDNPLTYIVQNNLISAQNFDIVRRPESAKITVQTGDSGYSALLTIPLAELGLDPSKASELKGTVGVIYSDPSGKNRAARLYWFDKATGLVSDVPSESQLDANRWGKIMLDK
jgi:hypothetical protein